MKKMMVILALFFMLGGFLFAEKINWAKNYDSALAQAQKTDKNIFLLITAPDWCKYCVMLEKKVLSQAPVIKTINKEYIPVKIMDSDPDVKRFQFRGYPTVRVLNKKGDMKADVYTLDAMHMMKLLKRHAKNEITEDGIKWADNYDFALEEAQKNNKNIFLLITAPDWCKYCVMLENRVLKDKSVIKYLNDYFVPVKILDSNPDIKRFQFRGYPTVRVLDKNGNMKADVYRLDPNAMLGALRPYSGK